VALYLRHFGLEAAPFSLTPDTEFFFGYEAHQEALNMLLVALRSGEGFIKVVGEVGTGKTLLCRTLMRRLGEPFTLAFVPNPMLNPNALRAALASELGIDAPRNLGQHRLLERINHRLIELAGQGRQVVVCIDEAQTMPLETLEALRLLTNLETEKQKLLQVVLFGQPELDELLDRKGVRQLRQRITFSHRLRPLDRPGVAQYVEHRLRVAGLSGPNPFRNDALRLIARASGGIPRRVNILAHKALLAAYGLGDREVGKRHVRMAVADTEELRANRRWWRWWPLPALALALGVVALWPGGFA